MTKKQWLLVTAPLFLVWLADLLTKQWASKLTQTVSWGPLNLSLYHNHGVMLGLFLELPSVLRIVTLSTGGAFLLCAYGLIQYLLPVKSLTLRAGLSILIGGIIGNVTDRIVWGYVVDFIIIKTPWFMSPAFNLADLLQWVGYGFIVFAIIRENKNIWPEYDVRRSYWIHAKFQLKYCFMLMAVGFGLSLISLVFSYTYFRVTISEFVGNNSYILNKFIIPYVGTYALISIMFSGILFAMGKLVSHRIAGPIYAFERFLLETLEGKDSKLKLRNSDEFKHLETVAEKVKELISDLKKDRTIQVVEFQENPEIQKTSKIPPSDPREESA